MEENGIKYQQAAGRDVEGEGGNEEELLGAPRVPLLRM